MRGKGGARDAGGHRGDGPRCSIVCAGGAPRNQRRRRSSSDASPLPGAVAAPAAARQPAGTLAAGAATVARATYSASAARSSGVHGRGRWAS